MIYHSKPFIGSEEAEALKSAVLTGQLAQGEQVRALEEELARYIGVRGAVAVSSGTAGLHLALLASGVGSSDKVLMPSYVCTALLNAVNLCNAIPVICDVEPMTGNIDIDFLKNLPECENGNLILPHMFGSPAKIDRLSGLNLNIIEDCAQTLGTEVDGKNIGSIGKSSVFSFYATKVICAGEGGAVLSDSKEFIERVRDLREYDNRDDYKPRFNYKLTEMQAAIARIQLKKLDSFIERRRKIASLYDEAVKDSVFTLPAKTGNEIFFRYILFTENVGSTIDFFRRRGIVAVRPIYKPLHYYLNLTGFPGTEEIFSKAVSVPCYPALTDQEISAVCEAILTYKG